MRPLCLQHCTIISPMKSFGARTCDFSLMSFINFLKMRWLRSNWHWTTQWPSRGHRLLRIASKTLIVKASASSRGIPGLLMTTTFFAPCTATFARSSLLIASPLRITVVEFFIQSFISPSASLKNSSTSGLGQGVSIAISAPPSLSLASHNSETMTCSRGVAYPMMTMWPPSMIGSTPCRTPCNVSSKVFDMTDNSNAKTSMPPTEIIKPIMRSTGVSAEPPPSGAAIRSQDDQKPSERACCLAAFMSKPPNTIRKIDIDNSTMPAEPGVHVYQWPKRYVMYCFRVPCCAALQLRYRLLSM
mmetsp:Transcript_139769/g.267957  ORF Transcript_139769/g.267957 Transcript_139769/m.267957 type:complete len:301 (-) Transcript_139769:313-1215(-)